MNRKQQTVVIYGPQGCGKNLHAAALAKHYGCDTVVEEFTEDREPIIGALHLTSDVEWAKTLRRAIPFDKAMRDAGLINFAEHSPAVAAADCIVQDKSSARAEIAALFSERMRKEEERRAALPRIRAEGEEALRRLVAVAQGNSGQCRHVAAFLLGLYNGKRFRFDLTDLRCIDHELFEDCMAVLRMDSQPAREVHTYFPNGGQLFEQLAKDWGVRDYTKKAQS